MKYLLLLAFFALPFISFAQNGNPDPATTEADTLKPEKKPIVRPKEVSRHAKAALLSAVLPGMGQAFNKSYWKVPFVAAGAVGFGLTMRYWNQQHSTYREALVFKTDGDPYTEPEFPYSEYNIASLKRGRDITRKYRDFTILLSIGFYGLQIADALADAHLKSFDIGDDLTLQLRPSAEMLPNGRLAPAMGMVCQF